jgi:hypothetical protein
MNLIIKIKNVLCSRSEPAKAAPPAPSHMEILKAGGRAEFGKKAGGYSFRLRKATYSEQDPNEFNHAGASKPTPWGSSSSPSTAGVAGLSAQSCSDARSAAAADQAPKQTTGPQNLQECDMSSGGDAKEEVLEGGGSSGDPGSPRSEFLRVHKSDYAPSVLRAACNKFGLRHTSDPRNL